MNNFGVSLVGKSGIYNKKQFFKPDAQKSTRTFIFEGGPGCEATAGAGSMGLQFGAYTVSGRWAADGERDVLDVRAFDCYIDAHGVEVEAAVVEDTTKVDVCPEKGEKFVRSVDVAAEKKPEKGIKPRGKKKAEKPAPTAEPVAAAPAEKPAKAAAVKTDSDFSARCVELYKSGTTNMTDLAEKMGYARGNGQTRCKRVLQAAGAIQ